MRLSVLALQPLLLFAQAAVRPVPPTGIEVSLTDRQELTQRLGVLRTAISRIEGNALAPDVWIYHEAVRYALTHNEFFKQDEILKAHRLLDHGLERARQLAEGKHPWTTATGQVVRGYRSRIDHSIQPYGLVVPSSYRPDSPHRWRLDAWFHGRNETLSEVNFLSERETRPGEFTPAHTIVLHLYGRFCNANRFAGEIDFHEALADVKKHYPIDENRILARGFSMGGAAAWHIGAHHAGLFAAVAPGAGFSETKEFLKLDLSRPDAPFPWEQTLWRMYDATEHAINFANTATVAYNGDLDGQKQAADAMERAMAAEGITLSRITGPQTGHRYHPQSKIEIDSRLDAIASVGRNPYPQHVDFTTFTLAYPRMKWIEINGLEQHWQRARITADIHSSSSLKIATSGVTAFTVSFPAGGAPFALNAKVSLTVNQQIISLPPPASDRSWKIHLRRSGGTWNVALSPTPEGGLAKVPGLQGPIDDAFLDSFLMVRPTGSPLHAGTHAWAQAEFQHAISAWRKQFRGEARSKEDTAITDEDIASSNLVLWGDPSSNRVLGRIAEKLPIEWTSTGIVANGKTYLAYHAPIFIFPNPLNPRRYVVINSGFTFREFDYLNNARQTPKLPDWAIVDTREPPTPRYPGRMVEAGFFSESWTWR